MDTLLIPNDRPNGTERSYDGLRLAACGLRLAKALTAKDPDVTVFLRAYAVS